MMEVRHPPPPMLQWGCVDVGAKDSDGNWGDARFEVLVWDDEPHNEVRDVSPEMIHICLGSAAQQIAQRNRSKKGRGKGLPREGLSAEEKKNMERDRQERANRELVGFFRDLFQAAEDQVKLTASNAKTKQVTVSGLNQDKRSLLWHLQAKIGTKFEAHWAADFANAAAAANNVEALKRKRELDAFQAEREKVLQRGPDERVLGTHAALQPKVAAGGVQTLPACRAAFRVKKKETPLENSAPVEEPTLKESAEAGKAPDNSGDLQQLNAQSDDAGSDSKVLSSLGGLAAYDSEGSDDNSEPENLVNPFS